MKYLTQSMIGTFHRCPQQFERIYVNGERIPPGISARRGSGVHKGAELNHSYKLHVDDDLPLDVLQDAARDEFVRLVKDEGVFIPRDDVAQKNKLLNDGLNAAIKLTALYHAEVAPAIHPALVEERIEFDAGLPLILSGAIDVFTVDGWLPDLKTADKSKNQNFADSSVQLTFYAALIHHRTGNWPTKLSYEVLVNNVTAKLQSLETIRGASDFADLLPRLDVVCQQIFSGIFPPCEPGHWLCNPRWCGFYDSCRYSIKKRG
jgi:hypothetical protein